MGGGVQGIGALAVAFQVRCRLCGEVVCVTNRVREEQAHQMREHLALRHEGVRPVTLGDLCAEFSFSDEAG